jgi:hypothetical protein
MRNWRNFTSITFYSNTVIYSEYYIRGFLKDRRKHQESKLYSLKQPFSAVKIFQAFLTKLTVTNLSNIIPELYGASGSVSVLTSAWDHIPRYLIVTDRAIKSPLTPISILLFDVCLGDPNCFFSYFFKIMHAFCASPIHIHAHLPCRFDHSGSIWLNAQILNLFITQLAPNLYYFLSHRPKYATNFTKNFVIDKWTETKYGRYRDTEIKYRPLLTLCIFNVFAYFLPVYE